MAYSDDNKTGYSLVERAMERMRAAAEDGDSSRPWRSDLDGGTDEGGVEPKEIAQSPSPPKDGLVPVDLARLRSAGVFAPDSENTRTTEEFRLIKRAILLNAANRKAAGSGNGNLIMVTSSREGEGKTFVCLNMALSIAAERDSTVLLVDADLSKPSVLSRLGLSADKGLVNVLEDPSIDLAEVLIRTDVPGLTVLPAGPLSPLSTELLTSDRMRQLMAEVSQRYMDRIVLLDAPPVLATSEAAALALHVGQIVFVVEADKTSGSAIREALQLIATCPNIGFVLNKAQNQFGTARFGAYYKSYRKSYYKKTYRRSPES